MQQKFFKDWGKGIRAFHSYCLGLLTGARSKHMNFQTFTVVSAPG